MVRILTQSEVLRLPAPEIVEADDDNFISLAQLREGLTVRIPLVVSPDLLPGDELGIGMWRAFKDAVVPAEGRDLLVPLTPDDVRDMEGRRVSLFYLNRRSGELSEQVFFECEGSMTAPVIDEAADGVVPIDVSATQASVRLRRYEDMQEGDLISLYLAGSGEGGSAVIHAKVEAQDVGKDVVLVVDGAAIGPNRGESLHLIFEVRRGAVQLVSPGRRYQVARTAKEIVPVYGQSVPGKMEGWYMPLTYEGEGGGIPVRVDFNAPVVDGDRASMLLMHEDQRLSMIVHQVVSGTATSLLFHLPYSNLFNLLDKDVYMACLVEGGTRVDAPPWALARVVEIVPQDMPGATNRMAMGAVP